MNPRRCKTKPDENRLYKKDFLELTGYYRKFIKDYSLIAKPMTRYLKKDTKINKSDPDYHENFNKLLKRYSDFTKIFTVTTDASIFPLGGVLSLVFQSILHVVH